MRRSVVSAWAFSSRFAVFENLYEERCASLTNVTQISVASAAFTVVTCTGQAFRVRRHRLDALEVVSRAASVARSGDATSLACAHATPIYCELNTPFASIRLVCIPTDDRPRHTPDTGGNTGISALATQG